MRVHTPAPPRAAAFQRDRYELEEELGRGGMGVIYRAFDRVLERHVAYKRLSVSDERARLRATALFQSEYNTLAQLLHPHIVEAYEYGVDHQAPYYTMELLSGRDLVLSAPLAVNEACLALRDIASALGLLHARRLLHRDVTPVNVRLSSDGRAKLLDFGALVSFGPQTQVVGTPAFIAPECLSSASLDQRTDLYSLGALLYFALTGQTAVRARTLEDLRDAWREQLVPPSQLVPAVPPALDELVMSMLQHDPVARPHSVAYVIERLNAIAGLPADGLEDAVTAAGYLAHPPLVGRASAQASLNASLHAVMASRGNATLVEALHGMGRSALLDHVELRAQLLGATVLRADAQAQPGALGVARALVRAALRSDLWVHDALRAQYPQAVAFCLHEGTSRRIASQHEVVIPAQTAERKAELAAEIVDCLWLLAKLNPTVVLVDDAQRCDPESLGVLASLARDVGGRALGVVMTLAIDESPHDPVLLAAYAERAFNLSLAALTPDDISALVTTLFGGAPNGLRTAQWLYAQTQGRPLHAMALANLLLSRQVVRYAAGMFSLPHELSVDFGALDLDAALLARFETLSEAAQTLARQLCIHGHAILVRDLIQMVELDDVEARHALDELVRHGIVDVTEETVLFAQRALCTSIESALSAELRAALHRRAAEALLARAPIAREQQVQAGLHLLRAGDEEAGAELLAEAAIALAYTAEGTSKIIEPLEAALAVFERLGRPDKACARVLVTLTVAGFYGDPRLLARYFKRTYDVLLELSGARVAAALGGLLGRRLALVIGVSYGWLTFFLMARKQRLPSFREVLTGLFSVAVAGASALASAYEPDDTIAVVDQLAPFAKLPKLSAGRAASDMCVALADLMRGWHATSVARLSELSTRLVRGEVRGLNDDMRQQMLLGCVYLMGINEVCTGGPDALMAAELLEREPREFVKPRAELLRMCHFGFRGEQDRADEHRKAAERLSLLGGNSWSALTAMAVRSLIIAQWTSDHVALVRVMEELERLSQFAPSMRDYRDVAEAYLAFSRGHAERALELHERVLRLPRRIPLVIWALQRAHYAQVLGSLGRHAQARKVCADGLADVQADNRRYRFLLQPLTHELALAEARLGDVRSAVRRMGELLGELGEHDNPLLLGSVHRDRARIALIARDRASFDRHLTAMTELFRATRNPCLIQQIDGLAAQAITTGVHPVPATFREARERVEEDLHSTTVVEPNKYS